MEGIIDQIKSIPIKEVADKLGIRIVKKNTAMCFNGHDKKTPSLSFNYKKNLWYCFACDIGGTNIDLVKEVLKTDIKEVLGWFQSTFNISTNSYFKSYKRRMAPFKYKPIKKEILEEAFYETNSEIYNFLLSNLSLSQAGLDYLKGRGFTEKVIRELNIVDIQSPAIIYNLLKNKWSLEELEKCGLFKYDPERKYYKLIWWTHTLIFPFFDTEKKVIYFQGRALNTTSNFKYLNLKGVSTSIYNLNSLTNISKGSIIYFFEGITDCIMGIQSGYNSFGILGASGFKDQWANDFTDFIINVVPDNDKGGETFSRSMFNAFYKIGKRVQIRKVPSGKDFLEFMNSKNKQNLNEN
jgi:DNA primase catalytic core